MRKQFIQQSDSQKRAKNFFDSVTSDDTLQIIAGQDNNTLLLWQDEYYMEAYLAVCNKSIKLSKVNTINFLKWLKDNNQELQFFIHPVFGQECLVLNSCELSKEIIGNIESDGDYYDILRKNDLL
ncbi:hypothetical protein NXY39_11140 [Bacteroides fragilis]|nr:hypothetical protein [Bacteroides fragilis]